MMLTVGRLCVKTAGRDAGNTCVVVEVTDRNFVVIDGNVRRKRCNIAHLEPLSKTLELSKGASHEDVLALFRQNKLLAKPKALKRPAKEKKDEPKPKKAAKAKK